MSGTERHRAAALLRVAALALGCAGAVVGFSVAPAVAAHMQQQPPVRVDAAVTIPVADTVVQIATGGALTEPTGGWLCPVAAAKFTNDWGQPRSGGRRHEGTDMLAPRGTPVLAPVAGTVKRSSSGGGGLTFNLKAADGFTYVGMHLSAYGGEGTVSAGDVIGYVGDTGNARGTDHLHFEIQLAKGAKLNPFATLKRYC